MVLLVENRSIWQEGATCLECPPNSYSPTVSAGFNIHGLVSGVQDLECASLGFRARLLVVGSRCLSVYPVEHRLIPPANICASGITGVVTKGSGI